jgi:NADH-quinone oxidoreductase subunit E
LTNSGEDRGVEATGRPAHDPVRPANPAPNMPYFSEVLSLNPILTHSAAAVAAATAIGLGFAHHMTSAFFGVMQSAMEAANRQKATQEGEAEPDRVRAAVSVETPVAPQSAESAVDVVEAPTLPEAVPALKMASKRAVAPKVKADPLAAPFKGAPAEKAKTKTAPKALVKAAPKALVKAAPEVLDKAVSKANAKAQVAAKVLAKPVPNEGGDLKTISGIGPKLEGVLKGLGITNVAQIAAWTDEDVARFDKQLGFEGRIGRDDWVGQAKALLK